MTHDYSFENIHVRIFHRLLDVIPDLRTIGDIGLSEVDGLMPLTFDVLDRTHKKLTIAMSHIDRHKSGEVFTSTEMTVAVYLDRDMAEALTYHDAYMSDSIYSPRKNHIDILAKRVLNDRLYVWLGNLISEGYSIKAKDHDE